MNAFCQSQRLLIVAEITEADALDQVPWKRGVTRADPNVNSEPYCLGNEYEYMICE